MAVELPAPPFAGGCQCGAVRYRLEAAPSGSIICHCRMCQKAGGAPFMAYAGVRVESLVFTRGAPAIYQSSDVAERGFCAACGTPLTYRLIGRNRVSVTIGSLDHPSDVAPTEQLDVGSALAWLASLSALPARNTEDWMAANKIDDVGSRQHPDYDT